MTLAVRSVLALAVLVSGVGSAQAQNFPNRTVTIVVTSAAGAATDVLTRAVAQRLSQKWGQNVIVENKGGGGHAFAAAAVNVGKSFVLLHIDASGRGVCILEPDL